MIRRALKSVADRQCGYFTSRQALSAGYIKRQHAYHTSCGNWLRIDRGLFRLAGYADTLESEFIKWSFWAIGMSAARSVVISHESAFYYYGLSEKPPHETHLSVPLKQPNKEERPGCVFHRQELGRMEIIPRTGFCITTPERTLLDMKPVLLLKSQWLEAVQLAIRKELISVAIAQELLGGRLYQQEMASSLFPTNAINAGTRAEARIGVHRIGDMSNVCTHQRRSTDWRVPNRSFTLVEMLVVIAVICLLAALLLPMLRKSVESSRSVACQNQCKQLFFSFVTYSEAFNNYFPPIQNGYGQTGSNLGTWTYNLWRVENQPDFLQCMDAYMGQSLYFCPSRQVRSADNRWDRLFYGAMQWGVLNRWTPNGGVPIRCAQVRFPSKTMLVADNSKIDEPYGGSIGNTMCATIKNTGFTGRHAGMDNMLYVDGHVNALGDPELMNMLLQSPALYSQLPFLTGL